MWIFLKHTHEFIYKIEIKIRCRKQTYSYQGCGGVDKLGDEDQYTLLCIK